MTDTTMSSDEQQTMATWNTARASITPRGTEIVVTFPYTPGLIAECKRLMGHYNGAGWVLKGWHRPAIEQLLAEYFPPDAALVASIITYTLSEETTINPSVQGAPQIDGVDLLRFARDWRGRVDHPAVIEVLEDTLRTGGSMKYPTLARGALRVRVLARPAATFTWGDPQPYARVTIEPDPARVTIEPDPDPSALTLALALTEAQAQISALTRERDALREAAARLLDALDRAHASRALSQRARRVVNDPGAALRRLATEKE